MATAASDRSKEKSAVLKNFSIAELVKRRFVGTGCKVKSLGRLRRLFRCIFVSLAFPSLGLKHVELSCA